ncbi:unnamed protein product, partial [Discosporangium mesarthrocarpum]
GTGTDERNGGAGAGKVVHRVSSERSQGGDGRAWSEASSTAAELQGRLESAWRALETPARLKLDFLERFSTPDRALDLPRVATVLEKAGKTIPLRIKVKSLLHRAVHDHEVMSPTLLFTPQEEETLCDLDCWVDFDTASPRVSTLPREGDDNLDERAQPCPKCLPETAETLGESLEVPTDGCCHLTGNKMARVGS